MSTHAFYTASGPVTSDSAATVNTVAERDSSGNASFSTVTGSTQVKTDGSLVLKSTAKSANFTADTASVAYVVDTTSGTVTATLPAAASSAGLVYTFKKIVAANSLILDGNASETIDGATTKTATAQWACATIWCDGTAWFMRETIGTWS